MKRPSLSLSVMVLVLQQIMSFLPMTLLMLCPFLLDRRISVCLQELLPAPPTPPAPLPVLVRLCLGRAWSLLRILRILPHPRSTSSLRCGRQGHPPHHARPPGVPLPRHVRPWTCPTHRHPLHRPQAPRHLCMCLAGRRQGSLLSGRLATLHTST